MKLFVDDLRVPEDIYPGETDWHVARTVSEAIRLLATQDISDVSIDHDIQCNAVMGGNGLYTGGHTSPETYEPVAWYLQALLANNLPNSSIKRITLHSASFVGRKKMHDILRILCMQHKIPLNELPGCPASNPSV